MVKKPSEPESLLPLIIIIGASVGGAGSAAIIGAVVMRKRKASKPAVKPKEKNGPENKKDNYSYESYDDSSN